MISFVLGFLSIFLATEAPSPSLIDQLIWVTMPIFYIAGWILLVAMPILIFLFWKKWMPKPARTLFWAARRGTPPLLLAHDSGRGEITTIHERKGEGIVMTQEGRYKILPRWAVKLPFGTSLETSPEQQLGSTPLARGDIVASETQTDQQTEASAKQEVEKANTKEGTSVMTLELMGKHFIFDYGDWTVKRTSLIGMNMPFFLGYTGKLCLLNPEALALYEAGEMMIRTSEGDLFNPKNLPDKNIANALQPLLLLDARKIQQIIYEGYDQSQVAGVVADSEELVRLGQGMSPKMKLLIGVIAIAALACLALFFLPQLLRGGEKQQQSSILFGLGMTVLQGAFGRRRNRRENSSSQSTV